MSISSLLVNTVVVKTATYTQDAEGGMVPSLSAGTSYSANVQPSPPSRTIDQGREGSRETHRVYFGADPVVKAGDQIVWGSRTFTVLGPAQDQSGRQRVFMVPCLERA